MSSLCYSICSKFKLSLSLCLFCSLSLTLLLSLSVSFSSIGKIIFSVVLVLSFSHLYFSFTLLSTLFSSLSLLSLLLLLFLPLSSSPLCLNYFCSLILVLPLPPPPSRPSGFEHCCSSFLFFFFLIYFLSVHPDVQTLVSVHRLNLVIYQAADLPHPSFVCTRARVHVYVRLISA